MNILFAAQTDVGRKRKLNEDSYCAIGEIGLFAVADGMGGHAAGEVASGLAAETVKTVISDKYLKVPYSKDLFESAVKLANKAVFQAAQKGMGLKGMGTTFAGILVDLKSGRIIMANVGDSRVYRMRGGEITQISTDHSMVAMQVAMGIITKEEAKKSTHKNVITRALGIGDTLEVDTLDDEIQKDDRFLICSDGLSNLVEEKDMLDIVDRNKNHLDGACNELVSLANFHGGDDNITVVVVRLL